MLPLVAILTITAIKDGIEDYRRHIIDNQVNNSAVTKLGNWRNVNQPRDARNQLQKLMGMGARSGKVSKGVRKLREKEDAIGMRAVRPPKSTSTPAQTEAARYMGGAPVSRPGTSDSSNTHRLETIASESDYGKHSVNRSGSQQHLIDDSHLGGASTASFLPATSSSAAQTPGEGVIDMQRRTPGTARWERTLWKKLEVGDIVLLQEDEQVPADMVLLNSSDPDGNAFVETKNLDGETNLKVRKCLKATSSIQTEDDIEHARFVIDCEPPHANLYAFNALLKFQQSGKTMVEPITANELLLRGCALRNTDWAIGIVVFTGSDTKIMLNGGETPSKRSKIEKETNVNVAVNFVILLAMCTACAIVGGLILNKTNTSRDYYEPDSTDSSSNIINALYIFGSCLVLYQNIVPISLYISIELTKTISAFFIYQDIDMYYEPLDHPCVPKTWGIVDDLGQIEYIFSDKTGTLTQNVMEFKKCSINGVSYGEGITEAMMGAMKRQGKSLSGLDADTQAAQLEEMRIDMVSKMTRAFKNRFLRPDKVTLISPQLADDMTSASSPQRRHTVAFFRALALCHTALADRADYGDAFTLEYKAQSPDEAALVAAARDVGAVYLNRNNQVVDIEVMGAPERYQPLKVLEFNSTRKRMSVIVREPDGRILMISKGADSVIYQRLTANHDEELKSRTQKDLEDFANAGLRTLCIAYRYLDEGEYLEWAKLHDEAAASLQDRDEAIDEVCERIEHDLTLMGATALEDKLQVGVPETIEKLHQAGIKLWILTGDKLQTAIEIGFSCNLLSSNMEIMIISADHEQGARAQLEAACNKIAASGRPIVVRSKEGKGLGKKKIQQQFDGHGTDPVDKGAFAVVVDGETLKFCLDKSLKPLFLALTTQCETVVCCRVSPAQKALTVRLVKDGIGAMSLAIGDGANDVSMIQEAHVGVGIAGLEGAQASMSADYAIGQFRFLAKLLLVHGHWNTYRIGVLHQVFFYKNLIWTFALLLFQIFCESNATYLFDYSLVLLFNLIFTSLPVIMLGSLDQDVRAPALLAFPQTYAPGREGKLYTRTQFWFACIDGIYQSIVCFAIPAAAWYYFPMVTANGLSLDPLTALGTTTGAACVLAANLYCGLMLQNWSVIIWVVIILSNLSYFIWVAIYSAPAFATTYTSTAFVLFGTVQFWVIVLICVVVSLLPRYVWIAWNSSFRPTHVDLVRQAWVKGDLKKRLGIRNEEVGDVEGEDLSYEKAYTAGASSEGDTERWAPHTFPPKNPNAPQQAGQAYQQMSRDTSSSLAEAAASSDGAKRASRGPRDSLMPNLSATGRESAFSFYDPDQITSSTPIPTRANPYGRYRDDSDEEEGDGPAFEVPQITVQRASGQSFYPQHASADSRVALASANNESVDSFEMNFKDAGLSSTQGSTHGQAAAGDDDDDDASPVLSPLQRFHNRFGGAQQQAPSPLQRSASVTDDAQQLPHHPGDESNWTETSFHTASGDDNHHASNRWQ